MAGDATGTKTGAKRRRVEVRFLAAVARLRPLEREQRYYCIFVFAESDRNEYSLRLLSRVSRACYTNGRAIHSLQQ